MLSSVEKDELFTNSFYEFQNIASSHNNKDSETLNK